MILLALEDMHTDLSHALRTLRGLYCFLTSQTKDSRLHAQAIPQESAIVCITWMSLPAKQQSNAPLTHDMTARYMRHCPLDETFAESKGSSNGSSAAPAVDAKAVPRLVKHDFDALDILCTADTAGEFRVTLSPAAADLFSCGCLL
jgi:hypothetical protein